MKSIGIPLLKVPWYTDKVSVMDKAVKSQLVITASNSSRKRLKDSMPFYPSGSAKLL